MSAGTPNPPVVTGGDPTGSGATPAPETQVSSVPNQTGEASEAVASRTDSGSGAPPTPLHPMDTSPSGGDSTTAGSPGSAAAPPSGDAAATPKGTSKRRSRRDSKPPPDNKEAKDKVMSVLWPHPELRTNFTKKAGSPVDAGVLLRDTRWRDMWVTFSKASSPSTRSRDALRREAVALIKAKKVSADKKAQSLTVLEEGSSQATDKRKRESSASSASSSTKAPPTSKPKTDLVAPAKFKPPQNPPPPASEAMEQQEDGAPGTIARQLTVEDLKSGIESVETSPSYAAATGGNTKVKPSKLKCDHILFITGGGEERTSISRVTWAIFLEKYAAKVVDLELDDKPAPSSDWTGFKAGQGIIACNDAESKALARDIVANIEVAEHTFRAWGKNEKGSYIPVTIPVPVELKSIPAGKIVALMHKINRLPEGSFKSRSVREAPNGKRYIHGVGHEVNLTAFLEKEGLEIDLKLTKVKLLTSK